MANKQMYSGFICKTKFNRLIDDGEVIENVKDEIQFFFFVLNSCDIDYYGTVGNKGIHRHELFDSPQILFNIARKIWRNVAETLYSDTVNVPLNETHMFILDLLNFTRITFRNEHWANPDIRLNLSIFKNSIIHITDLEKDSIMKLISGASRNIENPISQYLHLYLDTIWLLLTLDELDVKFLITQLSYYSFKCYEKNKKDYITCKCLKSVWLRLQLFCEHKGVDFWNEFNSALEYYDEEFLIHFIPFVACLHCYNSEASFIGSNCPRIVENLDFLSAKWSTFTKNTNQDLLKHLKHIEGLLCDLWLESAKLDILYSTWDYFYKKLEDIELDFDFITLLEKCRSNNVSDNSYLLFLRILFVQLKKHPAHWNKFRGRIYTRFSPGKFAKLNDKGVFNLMLLMVTLIDINFTEIGSKVLEFLQAVPPDRRNSVIIWKIYFILMELYIRDNRSIQPVTEKLIPLIQEVSLNRSQYFLLSLLPAHMDRITSVTKNLKVNQEVLFGVWIENYMKCCMHADLLKILNILILIVERVMEAGLWYIYEKALTTFVLPSLKRMATSGNAVEMVGTLAGMIASKSPDLEQLALLFSSENVTTTVIWAFFSQISKSADLPTEYDAVILKAWFQCAIIGEANQDFTKYALSLDIVKFMNLPTNTKFQGFIEQLEVFGYTQCLKVCFGGLEKWLTKHLNYSNESKLNIIYFNMGLVFKHLGNLLYSRSNATCPLSKFIDLLLLPTDILRGIKPHNQIIKTMQECWYVFVGALYKMSTNDPYLERVAKDIVVRYIPLFEDQEVPLSTIGSNLELMTFIITKMNNDFFLQGSTRSEHTLKALLIIKRWLEQILSTPHPKELVALVLPAIYDVYMFKNMKINAIDTLKAILSNVLYTEMFFSGAFEQSLMDVTKKHLPFNTSSYFMMMCVLAKVIPREVKSVLPYIKEEIVRVESKRGQGFDNDLRSSFDKLIKILD